MNRFSLRRPGKFTEEVDETRNGPARKCNNRFAQGSQVGANRRILLCMRRSYQRAWANGGHARMQQKYAESSLRKHHLAVVLCHAKCPCACFEPLWSVRGGQGPTLYHF